MRQIERLYALLLGLGVVTGLYGVYQWKVGPQAFASWSEYYGEYAKIAWSGRTGLVFRAFSTFVAAGTFAGNIISPYALPALPPAALVLAALVSGDDARALPRLAATALAMIFVVTAAAWAAGSYMEAHSQRSVVRSVNERAQNAKQPVYYWQLRFFSADYYGQGRVRVVEDAAPLARELAARHEFTLVVPERQLDLLPTDISQHLLRVGTVDSMLLLVPDYAARSVAAP